MSPLVLGLYIAGFILIGLSYAIRGPRVNSKIKKLQELDKARAKDRPLTPPSPQPDPQDTNKKDTIKENSMLQDPQNRLAKSEERAKEATKPSSTPLSSSTSVLPSSSRPNPLPNLDKKDINNILESSIGSSKEVDGSSDAGSDANESSELNDKKVEKEGEAKGKGKKKELTADEKKHKKAEMKQKFKDLKEKKRLKEQQELELLRIENKKRKEEEERRKREEEEELERKVSEEEEAIEREIQAKKEEKEKKKREEEEAKKREEEEKERLRKEEEERVKEAVRIKEANKPKPKPAWGGAALQKVDAVSIADLLFKKPTYDTEADKKAQALNNAKLLSSSSSSSLTSSSSNVTSEDPALTKLREERRRHRRVMLDKREREKAQMELFDSRASRGTAKDPRSAAEAEALAQRLFEKIHFNDDGITLTMDRNGNGNVSGVPETSHALLIGEGGLNVAVLKAMGMKVNVNGPLIKLEGYHEDIELAFAKIKLVVRWKQALDAAKSALEAKAHCLEAGLTVEAAAQQILVDNLRSQAAEMCFRFHNEGMGRNRLDLVGVNNDAEQLKAFERRIDEIERVAISSLPSDTLEIILPIPRNGPTSSQLERDVCAYLKDYHFKYEVRPGKGTRSIFVSL